MPTGRSAFPCYFDYVCLRLTIRIAWNSGTCLYLIWTGIANLTLFINSIIWRENAVNWAPVWCDICEYICYTSIPRLTELAARILIGVSFAIPASSLCINRRLCKISPVSTTKAEKVRMVMADLSVGIGIPVLGMVLRNNFFLSTYCEPLLCICIWQSTFHKDIASTYMKMWAAFPTLTIHG